MLTKSSSNNIPPPKNFKFKKKSSEIPGSAMLQPCFSHASALLQPCFSHASAKSEVIPLYGLLPNGRRGARPAARLEQPARPGAPYACGLPRMGAGQVLVGLRPVRPAHLQFPGLPARARPRACSGGPGRQVGQVPVSLDTDARGGSG